MSLLLLLLNIVLAIYGCSATASNDAQPKTRKLMYEQAHTLDLERPAEIYWAHHLPSTEMPQYIKDLVAQKNSFDDMKNYHPMGDAEGFGYEWTVAAKLEMGVERFRQKFGQVFVAKPDVFEGATIKKYWPPTTQRGQKFLTRGQVGDTALPLSMNKYPELMKRLGVNPTPRDTEFFQYSITRCQPNVGRMYEGKEEHRCVYTIESMVDYCVGKMKTNNLRTYISRVEMRNNNNSSTWLGQEVQTFKVERLELLTDESKPTVSCHTQPFPSALFLCHGIAKTSTYKVRLVSSHMLIDSFMVCHHDSTWWNPTSMALLLLNLKPGTNIPVCHFLEEGHLLWGVGEP